jgi:hypothetical protein
LLRLASRCGPGRWSFLRSTAVCSHPRAPRWWNRAPSKTSSPARLCFTCRPRRSAGGKRASITGTSAWSSSARSTKAFWITHPPTPNLPEIKFCSAVAVAAASQRARSIHRSR